MTNQVTKETEKNQHSDINSKDLVLKTDLLIGEKLLDEGKQLGLIGKVRAAFDTRKKHLAYFPSLSGVPV